MVRKSSHFFVLCLALAPMAWAADVDLADKPMASGTSGEVKPNVMLVLDDSGSMTWTYMPDKAVNFHGSYGYVSSHCNAVYYDPTVTYAPPVDAAGNPYPNASFTAARDDGFDTGSATQNLSKTFHPNLFTPQAANTTYNSSSYKSYLNYPLDKDGSTSTRKGDVPGFYYRYTGSQTKKDYIDQNSTFYKECNSTIGQNPGKGVFQKVTVSNTSGPGGTDERQNFANWYSYYRTRILTAKTAVGRAMATLSEPGNYRIGYRVLNATGTNASHAIDDFCAAGECTQRTNIYTKLYKAVPSGGTPLQKALSEVGRMYAGKTGSDPVQYSCQQNFTILTTDGFWNQTTGNNAANTGREVDGTTKIGNEDGSAPRPYWDGASSSGVETWRRYSYTTTTSGCSSGKRKLSTQEQRQTITHMINPPGATTTSGWTNQGKATTSGSCVANLTLPSPNPSDPTLVSSNTTSTGGSSHTLADVAMYYYETDLRPGTPGSAACKAAGGTNQDVCENNVPGSGTDRASHQHMTTFTLGLGVSGELQYCENYDSGGCPDFEAIRQGTKNWPIPSDDQLTTVDDLWHAAVNGRGKYFSAQSPESMAKGVQKALAGVSARTASAAAAATSNLEPIAGDNDAYTAMYTTVDWDGDITARAIDLTSGAVDDTSKWSAQAALDAKVGASSDSRTIYFNDGGSLNDFLPGNLGARIAANLFAPGPGNPGGQLSQYPDLSTAAQGQATQVSIINFLRGQTQHEDENENTWPLYRDRKHALGDIVNAAPVYVRKPPFSYSDDQYAQFAAQNEGRQSMVYAGANDGMLHAFNGDTGEELWAFIPATVIPHLYKLADRSYASNHRFYVDGPIVIGDFCPYASCTAAQWKTILVGGLGKGGRAYYALDVTNPASPSLLWEFTDDNLGYTFGNPVITKVGGQWMVIVASGYNNDGPGDGKGRLFVLNANTGAKVREILTDNTNDPARSGIAKINNWVDDTLVDNATEDVYGGDLSGNLWRFNVSTGTATKITTIGQGGVGTQPITTKPELAEIRINGTPTRVVLIGTGKYLGTSDIGSANVQSLYAIKDDPALTPYGTFRAHPGAIAQDLTSASGRQVSYSAMQADSIGWYMDFDVKNGERVNVDPKYQMGWWIVPTNIPDPNVCNIGGTSWLYFIDPWPTQDRESEVVWAVSVGNALIVGINVIKLPNGKIATIATTSDAKYPVFGNPPTPSSANLRRISWRELTR